MLRFILWFLMCSLCALGASQLLAHFMIGSWMVWFVVAGFGITYVQVAAIAGFATAAIVVNAS